MHVSRLWLHDVRSYADLDLELGPGLCAVLGPNGVGKTNLLEAVGFLALAESFRGAPTDAMIRSGADEGVIRATVLEDGREQLVEIALSATGRNRVQVNRQRLGRTRDLLGVVRVTAFSPDDLALVKGAPALRRSYLDQLVVALDPRHDLVRAEVERALRQRNALLKQTRGRLDEAARVTLDVWDEKFVAAGERLGALRADAVERLTPIVDAATTELAGRPQRVELDHHAPWRERGLAAALEASREDDLRRGVTLVGPQRDDLVIGLAGMPARTHASQGEQRTLALALRLGAHRLVHDVTGTPPVLLLDDVFSELDPDRSAALLGSLPTGQALLSSASGLPDGLHAQQTLHVGPDGRVSG